jgi:hypothetical protein
MVNGEEMPQGKKDNDQWNAVALTEGNARAEAAERP